MEDTAGRSRAAKACEACRKRKIKCVPLDPADILPNGELSSPCANCSKFKKECNFQPKHKRKGLADHVKELNAKCAALQSLLNQVAPDTDIAAALATMPDQDAANAEPVHSVWTQEDDASSLHSEEPGSGRAVFDAVWKDPDASPGHTTPVNNDDAKLDVAKYFGRASGFSVLEMISDSRRHPDTDRPIVTRETDGLRNHISSVAQLLSAASTADANHFDGIPQDLRDSLIDLYFERFNASTPVIHRPSFERALNNSEICGQSSFLALVHAIMAMGSRFSDDPRIFEDFGRFAFLSDPGASLRDGDLLKNIPTDAAGFAFAHASLRLASPVLLGATLYDLQSSVLMAYYLSAATSLSSTWNLVGFYMRRMLDVGAHRHKCHTWNSSALVDEQRKRAFWSLYMLDVSLSVCLGRPASIAEEQIDLTFPFLLTDEQLDRYDAKQMPFPRKRPLSIRIGTPPNVQGFNISIQLCQIMARVLQEFYKVPRYNMNPDQAEKLVYEIDKALALWMDRLPSYLRWDPQDLKNPHTIQRGFLLSMYNMCQLLVHRDFLSPERQNVTTLPSGKIALNCSRVICSVLWSLTRAGYLRSIVPQAAFWSCAAVMTLLSNSYVANPLPELDNEAHLVDLKKGIEITKALSECCWVSFTCYPGLSKLADIDFLRHRQALKQARAKARELANSEESSASSASPASLFQEYLNGMAPLTESSNMSWTGAKRPFEAMDTMTNTEANKRIKNPADNIQQADHSLSAPLQPQVSPFLYDGFSLPNFDMQAGLAADLTQAPFYDPEWLGDTFNFTDSNEFMSERQHPDFLSQEPFAGLFDPDAFGSSLFDFTRN